MKGRIIAWIIIVLALSAGLSWRLSRDALPPTEISARVPPRAHLSFPPPYKPRPAPAPDIVPLAAMNAAMRRLAQAQPDDERGRQALAVASDIHQFVMNRLDAAAAGNGEAQHQIYLALDLCRPFLRLDPETALRTNERMLGVVSDLSDRERAQWGADFGRCMGFAINPWEEVGDALGADRPGAVTEIASVWFQRAVMSAYPPALAELAFRPGDLGLAVRRDALEAALRSGNPEVYGLNFVHQLGREGRLMDDDALVWLMLACRTGFNCAPGAGWFMALECPGCDAFISPILYYWEGLAPERRQEIWHLAGRLPALISSGSLDAVPMPNLQALQDAELMYR